MANHVSISQAQNRALAAFLKIHMPKSLDKLASEVGNENALRLVQLNERVQAKAEE